MTIKRVRVDTKLKRYRQYGKAGVAENDWTGAACSMDGRETNKARG